MKPHPTATPPLERQLGLTPTGFIFASLSMCMAIALANYGVQFAINDWLTWGALPYPVCFVINDLVNRIAGPATARKVVYVGFGLAVVLSWWLATPRIAFASGSAFLLSQLLDAKLFSHWSRQTSTWWSVPLRSSACASVVDTWLFFTIAFAATGLPWYLWAIGDLGVKLAMALLMLLPFRIFIVYYPNSAQTRLPSL